MGGMDPQVRQPLAFTSTHSLIVCFHCRTCSVNYSGEEEVSAVAAVASSVVAEGDHKDQERRKISFIAYTSLSKISTRARPRNSRSHEMLSVQSATGRVGRKVLSRHATTATVGVSKSLCVRWGP